MLHAIPTLFYNFHDRRGRRSRNEIETLAAFVRDAEHDVLSVITALQAHVDLLEAENERNHIPLARFVILNRAIARIATDITVLSAFADHARMSPSNQAQTLETLMQEIAAETEAAFEISQVKIACTIVAGTMLIGNRSTLKVMITALVLAILNQCQPSETVSVVGLIDRKRVCLSVNNLGDTAVEAYQPWKLGQLHMNPSQEDGISLAAIEAMARMHQGHFSFIRFANGRHAYRLIFES